MKAPLDLILSASCCFPHTEQLIFSSLLRSQKHSSQKEHSFVPKTQIIATFLLLSFHLVCDTIIAQFFVLLKKNTNICSLFVNSQQINTNSFSCYLLGYN